MIDAVEAFRDIELERVLRPKPDTVEERSNGIVAGASRAKAIGMRRQLGFPFGFQGLAHEGLPCPFMLGGNPEWALFSTSTLGDPDAAQGCGLTIETPCLGQSPPSSWREGFHAVNARGMFAAVILADPTHRQQPGIPGFHQHLLREGTGLTEGHWRLLRSQFPLLASVGRCSPPGF